MLLESSQALPVFIAVSLQLPGKKEKNRKQWGGEPTYVPLCWLYLARFWWQEGCKGDLYEKNLGAAPSVVPLRQHSWNRAKHTGQAEEKWGGKSEKQQRKHQGQRMKKKNRFFRYQSRYSPAAQGEDHTIADRYSWNNCSQWKDHIGTDFLFPEGWQLLERTHTWEGGKCVEEGAAERNCCVLTVNHSYHPPCNTQEGDERSPEWRSEVEPGKRRCCFNVCIVVSHYPTLFKLAIN